MSIQDQNKALSRNALAEIDKGNLAYMDRICAPGMAFHFPGVPALNLDGFKGFVKAWYASFPDLVHDIQGLVAEGDKVVRWGVFTGTHKGDFQGLAPTGKRITVSFMAVDRFQDGKLVELNALMDAMGMMQQLGAIPAAAA